MQIKDVMTPNPVTVTVDATVSDVAGLLKKYRIGGLPVMDGERVSGIVTENDILSLLDSSDQVDLLWLTSPLDAIEGSAKEKTGNADLDKIKEVLEEIGNTPVIDVMSQEVVMIEDEASVQDGAKMMHIEDIGRLPVIKDDRLAGIVTRRDIIRGIGLGGVNTD